MLWKRVMARAGAAWLLVLGAVLLVGAGPAVAARFVWRLGALTDPHLAGAVVTAATCAPANLCVGVGRGGEIYSSTQPTGGETAWSRVYVRKLNLNAVSCPTESFCAAVAQNGDEVTSRDPAGPATGWRVAKLNSGPLQGVSCPTAGLCLAFDRAGNLFTSTAPGSGAGAWSSAHVDASSITDVACASPSLCVAVDGAGNVLSSSDPTGGAGAWQSAPVSGTALVGVACAPPSLCIATDQVGAVWSSNDPTGDSGSWHRAQVDPRPTRGCADCVVPDGVSCPTDKLCLMIDTNGTVWTSKDPTGSASSWSGQYVDALSGGYQISCGSSSLCAGFAPGGDWILISQDPAGPSGTAWDSGVNTGVSPYGVLPGWQPDASCPSQSFCAVIDPDGNVATSGDPTSPHGTWKLAHITQGLVGLVAISCRSARFCAALDTQGDVLVSHDPAADASSWTAAKLFDSGIAGLISCPSSSLCVAVSGRTFAVSRTPAGGAQTWHEATIPANPRYGTWAALSCASVSLCAATDGVGGDVLISTNPAAGATTWKLTHLGNPGSITGWVSCARRFCAALSTIGLFTTLDANAARPAWKWRKESFGGTHADAISCASSSLCTTAGFDGLSTSTRPYGSAGTWSGVAPSQQDVNLLGQVSCPTTTTCFALAGHGHMVVGHPARSGSRRASR